MRMLINLINNVRRLHGKCFDASKSLNGIVKASYAFSAELILPKIST